MIISTPQGQSLKEVGTDLCKTCFSHSTWLAQELVKQKVYIYKNQQENRNKRSSLRSSVLDFHHKLCNTWVLKNN
jgi:hypothetical protein